MTAFDDSSRTSKKDFVMVSQRNTKASKNYSPDYFGDVGAVGDILEF